MTFETIARDYLANLQREVDQAARTGEYTAELSYRPQTDNFIKAVAAYTNADVGVIFEPRVQRRAGRPDWRFYNVNTLGVYGYAEAKPINPQASITIADYQDQIDRYLVLGYKVILTDGLDFVFYSPGEDEPTRISLVSKPLGNAAWQNLPINPLLENQFRSLFRAANFRSVTEPKLIQDAALRAKRLSESVQELADLPNGAGLNDLENNTITSLRELKEVVENHHDKDLRNPKTFGDFVAQILVFGLVYAFRMVMNTDDTPQERHQKINDFWLDVIYTDYTEHLRPFRALVEMLNDELHSMGPLGVWYSDVSLLLAYTRLDGGEEKPDYHALYEQFLTAFDPETRFDYGAFYTPHALAHFITRATEAIVSIELPELPLYAACNKLIDPCCGTGTFLEEMLIRARELNATPSIVGFEILPAPYALAQYRVAMVMPERVPPEYVEIVLTNTLRDELEHQPDGNATDNLIALEQENARRLSTPPLKLIIGNPPSSDSARHFTPEDYTILSGLIGDFRPPQDERRSRQNTQKQVQNEFLWFLRWACEKLVASQHGILAMVLPRAFAENSSYKFARKWMSNRFSKLWIMDLDSDARTGIRASSLFNTLQGRMLLIGHMAHNDNANMPAATVYYKDIATLKRGEKTEFLNETRSARQYIDLFERIDTEEEEWVYRPSVPFDIAAYDRFWPLSPRMNVPADGEKFIFERHCSCVKLAPSSLFVHSDKSVLYRRSREIATPGQPLEDIMTRWYRGQDKPPPLKKLSAEVRAAIGVAIAGGPDTAKMYSYRPMLNAQAIISEPVLRRLSTQRNSGTRYRPEVLAAFATNDTIGIAVAPSPKEIGERLHRFASFCWYLPDNDLSKRGNAHVFCNKFPAYKTRHGQWNSTPVENVHPALIAKYTDAAVNAGLTPREMIVFYVYGVLCSDAYLDEFEGALFRITAWPRIPFPDDEAVFTSIALKGTRLAELEKEDNLLLRPIHDTFQAHFTAPFDLTGYKIDLENETISLESNKREAVSLRPVPIEVLEFQIAGYNVIQQWLKFHEKNYTRTSFNQATFEKFLDLLDRIRQQIMIVRELDIDVTRILSGEMGLFTP